MKQEEIEPSPKRSKRTWDEFLKSHAETLWSCDFFSVKTVTRKGVVNLYVLVFLHLESRRLIVSPATQHPDSAWVTEQAKAFREQQKFQLIHDRDAKFSTEFRKAIKEGGVTLIKLPVLSPNLKDSVAYYTSFIQWETNSRNSLRSESLRPWLLDGAFSSGGSNRHSCLSL